MWDVVWRTLHLSSRKTQSTILSNLRMVVGLAISNDGVSNAGYQASHILAACEWSKT